MVVFTNTVELLECVMMMGSAFLQRVSVRAMSPNAPFSTVNREVAVRAYRGLLIFTNTAELL